MQELLQKILKDIKVELAEEFDRNFERKAFFDKPWDEVKNNPGIGSLMIRTGRLRNSFTAKIIGTKEILFSSDTPYAEAHNEGLTIEIPVTEKMKKWAWAMYYLKIGGKNLKVDTSDVDKGKKRIYSKIQKNTSKNNDAGMYKAIALTKQSTFKVKLPKRQIIGDHPYVDTLVKKIIDEHVETYANTLITNKLKQK